MTAINSLFTRPSFKTELNIKITLLVIVPVLFSALYFSIKSYNQAIDLAYDDVQRNASSLALDMKTEITGLKYGFSTLSNNRVLGEIPVNILFSQYAFNQLKSLVLANDAIDAAFISDGSEFIIEGFPLETLKFDSAAVKSRALQTINIPTKELGSLLFSLPSAQTPFADEQTSNYLFIVLPLRRQLPSLVTPSENTAALFLMLNPMHLVSQVRKNTEASIALFIEQEPLFQDQKTEDGRWLEIEETIFTAERDGLNMSVSLAHKTDRYLQDVIASIGFTIVFVLALLAIVLWFARHFTQRLSKPIKALEAQSKRFADGDYLPSNEEVVYAELETLQQTLNNMATTITNQLSSLKEERNKAEASEKMKARFLANMSHEIRTPLNGVIGLLKMIGKAGLTREQDSWLASANQSANLLLAVVNDILDFSKIEAGKVVIETIPCNLQDILDNVTASASPLIKDKALTLVTENQLTHQYWHCDPTRLTQILVNLTSNAIKFTSKGKVTVNFSEQMVNNKPMITFSVIDTGIGIAADKVGQLFRSFEQADASTTREFGGTGLGLAISQQLAQLMGGHIAVNSQPGVGSTFTLSIPLSKANKPLVEQNTEQAIPELATKHILVAEDNKINQTILAHALKQTHCQMSMVENGKLAVEFISNNPTDLILMDVQMPEMDGVEATKAIRQLGYSGPIIMQTANVLDDEVNHYLTSGANAHISKPIDADELYGLLSHYIS